MLSYQDFLLRLDSSFWLVCKALFALEAWRWKLMDYSFIKNTDEYREQGRIRGGISRKVWNWILFSITFVLTIISEHLRTTSLEVWFYTSSVSTSSTELYHTCGNIKATDWGNVAKISGTSTITLLVFIESWCEKWGGMGRLVRGIMAFEWRAKLRVVARMTT